MEANQISYTVSTSGAPISKYLTTEKNIIDHLLGSFITESPNPSVMYSGQFRLMLVVCTMLKCCVTSFKHALRSYQPVHDLMWLWQRIFWHHVEKLAADKKSHNDDVVYVPLEKHLSLSTMCKCNLRY